MIFLLLNLLRVNPLILDTELSIIAEHRAEIVSQDWSHAGWKESFRGTNCTYQAENLARDLTEFEAVIKWLQSPTHRTIILSDNYNTVGIGHYENITVNLFCHYE